MRVPLDSWLPKRRLALHIAVPLLGVMTSLQTHAASESASESPQPDSLAWLEEVEGKRALEWVQTQNERSLKQLTEDPRYQRYYDTAIAIAQDKNRIPAATVFDGWLYDGWVYNLWQDETHPRGLFRRAPLDSYKKPAPAWQTLLDVDALAQAEDRSWELRSPVFLPPHGRRCMIGLVDGGKDAITYREFDLERRAFLQDGFVLPEARSWSLFWNHENTLLVATDWGAGSLTSTGSPFIVRQWSRGQPLSAAKEVFRDKAGVGLQHFTDETRERVTVVSESDAQRRMKYWTLDPSGQREQMMLPPHAQLSALHRGEWVFSIKEDWTIGGKTWKSGSLLSVPATQVASSSPPTVRLLMAPGPREAIGRTDGTRDGVLVISYSNARGQLLRFTFEGERWSRQRVPLPDDGTINLVMSDPAEGTTFVRYESFLQPPTVYAVDVAANRATPIKSLPPQFDANRYVTEQLEATSRDGTRVSYFLVRPKTFKANGRAPTLMHGYGYQGFSQFPYYSGFLGRLWLDEGGVYVLANIRGGGEFGPAWHVTKTQRQLVYDDFIAVAEGLIRRRITSPRHLGIRGMSAGGLLMGVMLTQRPDLFNAAVVEVPVLDLLDDNLLGGRARFAVELGSLDIPEERAFLERTSPYQNLRKRDDFPVPFLVTSTTDEKAHPAFARKFGAKMEALGMPFLYYESAEGGHNVWSTPQQHAMYEALFYTYLAQQLM